MEPISYRQILFQDLPLTHQAAIVYKNGEWENIGVDIEAKLLGKEFEWGVYRSEDVKKLISEVWGWPVSLNDLDNHDRDRVVKIMDLIPIEGQWPYLACGDLLESDPDDGPAGHVDGWHRCIAAFELGLPTIDICFI